MTSRFLVFFSLFHIRAPLQASALVALAFAAALASCGEQSVAPVCAPEPFVEVAEQAGVVFRHVNGMSGEFYYPEIIGAGVALFDYNNDGRLDLLVLQGGPLAPGQTSAATTCNARLYRNDTVETTSGERSLKFTDVTEASHLCSRGYGMGVAIGD